ncbi:MAG: hypothetical protein Tsb0021_16740 [Chlamydiales bacterium]
MKNILLCGLLITILSSCSVMMATRGSGTSIKEIQTARTRHQMLCSGAIQLHSTHDKNDCLVETYRICKDNSSAARALMHGLLDLCTGCMWEAIGTPIEASINKKEYYCIKVTYNKDETINKIELL